MSGAEHSCHGDPFGIIFIGGIGDPEPLSGVFRDIRDFRRFTFIKIAVESSQEFFFTHILKIVNRVDKINRIRVLHEEPCVEILVFIPGVEEVSVVKVIFGAFGIPSFRKIFPVRLCLTEFGEIFPVVLIREFRIDVVDHFLRYGFRASRRKFLRVAGVGVIQIDRIYFVVAGAMIAFDGTSVPVHNDFSVFGPYTHNCSSGVPGSVFSSHVSGSCSSIFSPFQ